MKENLKLLRDIVFSENCSLSLRRGGQWISGSAGSGVHNIQILFMSHQRAFNRSWSGMTYLKVRL